MFVKSGSCIFEPGEVNGGRGWGGGGYAERVFGREWRVGWVRGERGGGGGRGFKGARGSEGGLSGEGLALVGREVVQRLCILATGSIVPFGWGGFWW